FCVSLHLLAVPISGRVGRPDPCSDVAAVELEPFLIIKAQRPFLSAGWVLIVFRDLSPIIREELEADGVVVLDRDLDSLSTLQTVLPHMIDKVTVPLGKPKRGIVAHSIEHKQSGPHRRDKKDRDNTPDNQKYSI